MHVVLRVHPLAGFPSPARREGWDIYVACLGPTLAGFPGRACEARGPVGMKEQQAVNVPALAPD